MKKLLSTMLAVLLILTTAMFAACGGGGNGEVPIDPSKVTTIKIVTGGGGLGTNVIENAAKRFEDKFKDKKYAEGKQGVNVEVEPVGVMVTISESLLSEGYHVIYTSDGTNTKKAASQGWIMNVDDIIRKNIQADGKSILDKIPDLTSWNYCLENVEGTDNADGREYYSFPAPDYYGGLSYDKDLFDTRGFYVADASKKADDRVSSYPSSILLENYYFTAAEECKSVGPNGIKGDEDDGMPSSLYELICLCEYLTEEGISPFLISGQYAYMYINYFADALCASLSGIENAQAMNSFESDSLNVVTGFTDEDIFPGYSGAKKPIVETIKIDESCGYYTTMTLEKYYTYVFFQLMDELDPDWYGDVADSGTNHTGTQADFIYGKNQPERQGAFLIECSYWYNESTNADNFLTYKVSYPSEPERQLRWMSLPVNIATSVDGTNTSDNSLGVSESKKGETPTFCSVTSGYVCVNNSIKDDKEMIDALTDWFTFFYSDEELSKQAVDGGYGMALEYEVNPADYANAPSYIKAFYELRKDANVVYAYADNSVFRNHTGKFQKGGNSTYFATGPTYATSIRDSLEAYGITKCFTDKIITKEGWAQYYGSNDTSVMPSAVKYPVGHPKAGQEIKFEN